MKNKRSIIRYDKEKVDDVVIDCTLFRMEQMTNDIWWIAAYRGNKRVSFYLKGKNIKAELSEDDLGCIDDSL